MGTGLGTTPLLLEEKLDVHNSILQSFTEMGIIGLTVFLGWLVAIGVTIRRALKIVPHGLSRATVVGSAAAASAVAAQLLTENHLTAVAPLWYLAIGIGWCGAVATGGLERNCQARSAMSPDRSGPEESVVERLQ